jgi:hypothetical protein
MAVEIEGVWCVGLMSEDGIRGRVYPDGHVEVSRKPVWSARFDKFGEGLSTALFVWLGLLFVILALRLAHVISPGASKTLGAWWLVPPGVVFLIAVFGETVWATITLLVYHLPIGAWRWIKRRRAA